MMTLFFSSAITVSAVDDSALYQAHETLLADNSFDFEYADFGQIEEPPTPRVRNSSNSSLIEAIFGIIKVFFYAACVGIVIMIAYFISRELIHIKKPTKTVDRPASPAPSYRPDVQTARVLLKDAAQLAEEGRFDEAVHMILLRTIQDIKDKRPRAVPNALTSREISHLEILSQAAQKAFADIGSRVERSLFGGRALGKTDYEASRAAYETFAFEPVNMTVQNG